MNGRFNLAVWLIVLGGGVPPCCTFTSSTSGRSLPTTPCSPLRWPRRCAQATSSSSCAAPPSSAASSSAARTLKRPSASSIGRAMARSGETIEINNEVVTVDRSRMPSPRGCDHMKVFDPTRNEEVQLDCSVEEYAGSDFNVLVSRAFPVPRVVADRRVRQVVSRERRPPRPPRFARLRPYRCQHLPAHRSAPRRPAGISDADSRFTFVW